MSNVPAVDDTIPDLEKDTSHSHSASGSEPDLEVPSSAPSQDVGDDKEENNYLKSLLGGLAFLIGAIGQVLYLIFLELLPAIIELLAQVLVGLLQQQQEPVQQEVTVVVL